LTPPIRLWRDGALAGQQSIRRKKTMDKEKLAKMAEMMKGCCTDEGSISSCCSMMKEMMRHAEGEKTDKEEKNAVETE
jgi:hypothetical protein